MPPAPCQGHFALAVGRRAPTLCVARRARLPALENHTVLIIPAYNEGGRVGDVVREVRRLGCGLDIVVIQIIVTGKMGVHCTHIGSGSYRKLVGRRGPIGHGIPVQFLA